MITRSSSKSPFVEFEVHKRNSSEKTRQSDSPTSSILKTPTAIFVSSRSSSTKKLKFANGPVDLQSLKNNASSENITSKDLNLETSEDLKSSTNGETGLNESTVEISVSPTKTMQVSPETWEAFLEYKKYFDYPNETEKTDYTYSRLSKFRHKEIIPGFLIRPNLSRSSISSRRSSDHVFSNQSSFTDSFLYDFKVGDLSNADINYDVKTHSINYGGKTSNINYDTKVPRISYDEKAQNFDYDVKNTGKTNTGLRSKYYLRSSTTEDTDVGEIDAKPIHFEKEYLSESTPEMVSRKSVLYNSMGPSKISSQTPYNYMTQMRSLDLDEADIDEVDDQSLRHQKSYLDSSWHHNEMQSRGSNYFSNFFSSILLFLTATGTQTKDLFSKYILRRNDDFSPGGYRYSRGSRSLWSTDQPFISGYYPGQYYHPQMSWYQKFFCYVQDKFSAFTNLLGNNRISYAAYDRKQQQSKRKFWWWWWLLIPLLILTGSFLGYIDFFSNPKAILNTMYKCLCFFPSFLYYTVMVFIPRLIFELIPYFVLKAVPNFVTVTVPNLFKYIVYYFWEVVHYFASISIGNIWKGLLAAPQFIYNTTTNFVTASSAYLLNVLISAAAKCYSFSSAYLMLFFSVFCTNMFEWTKKGIYNSWQVEEYVSFYVKDFCGTGRFIPHYHGFFLFKADEKHGFIASQYKALDCKTNGLLTSLEYKIKPVWRSTYLTYKRATAALICYAYDSWERLKLPFAHASDWLVTNIFGEDNILLNVVHSVWDVLWQGIVNVLQMFRDAFSNLYQLLIGFLKDLFSAFFNVLHYIFQDLYLMVTDVLSKVFKNTFNVLKTGVLALGSSLYLLLFSSKGDIMSPEISSDVCRMSQSNIDKMSVEEYKNIALELSNFKKRFNELESNIIKEKELLQSQNSYYTNQFKHNNFLLQNLLKNFQTALIRFKRPGLVSNSTIKYFLEDHFNEMKQWIIDNFLHKTDSHLDEKNIAPLIAKHVNKTEELMTLKEEFKQFAHNHKIELGALRKDFRSFATSNFGDDISVAYIKKLVEDAIKLYDADKTGRVDFALETAGGQIISIRCTETYIASPKSYFLMGWPVYTKTSSPRDAISPNMAAGQCWAFVGSHGYLVIQLSHNIKVTGFTMEHISRNLVPRGHIESAPKNFSMWGLKSEYDSNPYLFGEYMYLDNDETLQYFPVTHPTPDRYNMVELKITSNHGNPNYTCLYRIRVHGDWYPI